MVVWKRVLAVAAGITLVGRDAVWHARFRAELSV